MRTIPVSMTWEILAHGRWHLLLATLGVIAIPALVLMALRQSGSVDSHDASMLNMHIIMMCTNVFIFGAALYAAQGRVSRLYTYPLRTSAIVAWRLLPAMLIMVVQMAVSIAILNAIFDLQWPIWGPAMFAAVSFAAVEAVAWLTEKSAIWLAIGMAAVGSVLGLWFRSRYGSTFSQPLYFWQHVTAADVFTMLTLAAVAYWVAVKAIARNRRGEQPLSLGFVDWVDRTFNATSNSNKRLGTPFQAQCWHEWQRKGWAIPAGVLICLVAGVVGWLFGSRRADDLFMGFIVGGAGLALFGFISGILFGNVGPVDSDFAMGTFLASRPLSDADMARAILQTAFKSVVLAWSIWLLAFLIACGCLVASGSSAVLKFPDNVSWWYFPCTLLGPWIVTGTIASLGLIGHSRRIVQVICAAAVAPIIISLTAKFVLTPPAQLLFERSIAALVASALLIASVWAFVAARRRGFIQSPTVWGAGIAWLAAFVAVALLWPEKAEPRLFGYLLAAAVLALVVAPLAAAPLALSSNRHR